MYEFLDSLRARPEHHRKAIAFGISAVFTLFVFIGWSSTVDLSIGGITGANAVVADENGNTIAGSQTANLESVVTPFNSITESIGSAISDFKDHLDFSKKTATVVDKAHNPVPGLLVNPEDKQDTKKAVQN